MNNNDLQFRFPANFIVSGQTGSGKSQWFNKVLLPEIKREHNVILILCSTCHVSGDYDHLNDDHEGVRVFKYHKMDEIIRAFNETIEQQEQLYVNHKRDDRERIPQIAILLDDLVSTKMLTDNGPIAKFAVKARHFGISLIILTQKLNGVARQTRLNSAYLIVFVSGDHSEVENMLEKYIPKRFHNQFKLLLEQHFAIPYQHLFFNNRVQGLFNKIYLADDKYSYSPLTKELLATQLSKE